MLDSFIYMRARLLVYIFGKLVRLCCIMTLDDKPQAYAEPCLAQLTTAARMYVPIPVMMRIFIFSLTWVLSSARYE